MSLKCIWIIYEIARKIAKGVMMKDDSKKKKVEMNVKGNPRSK